MKHEEKLPENYFFDMICNNNVRDERDLYTKHMGYKCDKIEWIVGRIRNILETIDDPYVSPKTGIDFTDLRFDHNVDDICTLIRKIGDEVAEMNEYLLKKIEDKTKKTKLS